jgi:hypothetical protein
VESHDQRRLTAVATAAGRLQVDYAAAAAIRALEAGGIPCILLKGASVARWLYEAEDAHAYVDCDLLVPSADFRSAVEALETLGFEPVLDEADMPVWWREHALTTVQRKDGTVVDLHRNLPGVQVSDEQMWTTLSQATDKMTLGDVTASVLTEPGRGFHAALHVAQHGGSARALDVLGRAIERMDDEAWREAATLSSTLEADAAFQRGLSFLAAGSELVRKLGLEATPVIEVELRAANAAEALTLARLLATHGVANRLSVVRYKLIPPSTFMRKWSPLARKGRLGLAAAYVWRPFWVLGRIPRAIRSWSQARRADPQ